METTGLFLPYMLQRFEGISGIFASMGMMDMVDAEEKKIHFEGNEKYNGLSEKICKQNAQMLLRNNGWISQERSRT